MDGLRARPLMIYVYIICPEGGNQSAGPLDWGPAAPFSQRHFDWRAPPPAGCERMW
jgi:hypothetical protein